MISPPGLPGVSFTTAAEGDVRGNVRDRGAVSDRLGLTTEWAVVDQVHGARVERASASGSYGAADALFTTTQGLPVAVFTADCLGVALVADGAIGVAHAGWRGTAAGVVPALLEAMRSAGHSPTRAAIGPGIGPCCYEVGPEVQHQLMGGIAETTWGTTSVDLPRLVRAQLAGLEIWAAVGCTRCSGEFHSHRADGTSARMATIAWID